MTWPKKLTKTNTNTKTMTKTKTKSFWEHLLRAILETCDIWDTDYNSDNWEPEFMTIFVTWQLIVTLDSIRNSCDVFMKKSHFWVKSWDWDPPPLIWILSQVWPPFSRPFFRGSNKLFNWWDIAPPFMYYVFHHIYGQFQGKLSFGQFW